MKRKNGIFRKALPIATAVAAQFLIGAPHQADANPRKGPRSDCTCGCRWPTTCRCQTATHPYYCAWKPTIRIVRENLWELPAGYRRVCINGIYYYTYPNYGYSGYTPFRPGNYFRALGESDAPMEIVPP